MFNSLRICAQVLYYVLACSILSGYVHKYYVVLSDLYVVSCSHVQSLGICARILHSDLLDYFLVERFTGDIEELTREYTFIEKCFGDDSDLP